MPSLAALLPTPGLPTAGLAASAAPKLGSSAATTVAASGDVDAGFAALIPDDAASFAGAAAPVAQGVGAPNGPSTLPASTSASTLLQKSAGALAPSPPVAVGIEAKAVSGGANLPTAAKTTAGRTAANQPDLIAARLVSDATPALAPPLVSGSPANDDLAASASGDKPAKPAPSGQDDASTDASTDTAALLPAPIQLAALTVPAPPSTAALPKTGSDAGAAESATLSVEMTSRFADVQDKVEAKVDAPPSATEPPSTPDKAPQAQPVSDGADAQGMTSGKVTGTTVVASAATASASTAPALVAPQPAAPPPTTRTPAPTARSIPTKPAQTAAATSTAAGARPNAAASGAAAAAPLAQSADAGATGSGAGGSDDQAGSDATGNTQRASAPGADGSAPSVGFTPTPQAATASALAVPSAAAEAPTAAGTVANLSAQIVQQAGGKTSRFDVQMTPEGFGRVDVSVQIDAQGKVTAALSFEKPEAAALVKGRSEDLHTALAAAGLDLAPEALKISHTQAESFAPSIDAAAQQTAITASASTESGGQTGGQGAQSGQGQPQHFAAGGQSFQSDSQSSQQQSQGRAPVFGNLRSFEAAASAADVADLRAAYAANLSARGLDIRI